MKFPTQNTNTRQLKNRIFIVHNRVTNKKGLNMFFKYLFRLFRLPTLRHTPLCPYWWKKMLVSVTEWPNAYEFTNTAFAFLNFDRLQTIITIKYEEKILLKIYFKITFLFRYFKILVKKLYGSTLSHSARYRIKF